MGCYNGAKYIADQLDSIESQTHQNWCVYASDDGSTDGTLDILKAYQVKWGSKKLVIIQGPCNGFCENFLTLACNPKIVSDYYAFCDQDDVWLPEKLSVALSCLYNKSHHLPHVYGSRTTYVNSNLKLIGHSHKFTFPPSFRNAFVQSIAGGNTLVFNSAAKSLLERIGVVKVASHDWWLYIICEAAGGCLTYDLNSYILYRQHSESLVGSNDSLLAKYIRLKSLLSGQFKRWNRLHLSLLLNCRIQLTDEATLNLLEFSRLKEGSLKSRLRMLNICGFYRQGWRGQISLYVAVILNKF